MVYTIMNAINLILGLNSITVQILFGILSIIIAIIFGAGDKDKGYLKSFIVFPFLNLLCVIFFSLLNWDFTINAILFFIGIVLMALGIYINRNNEQILA